MKKVAILGYCPSYKNAPFSEKNTEIWIMNDMYEMVSRYDRLFDIHDINEIKSRKTRNNGVSQFDMLTKIEKPVYMQDKYCEIQTSVKYPLEQYIKKYKTEAMGDKLFVTCSVAYMLLMAIDEGFDQIELFGIHEAVDDEYKDEMPGVIYWLAYAEAKGIKVKISSDSPLMKGWFMYGYEEKKFTHYQKFLTDELTRINGIKDNASKIILNYQIEKAKCDGAASILQHIQKITSEI